MNAMSQKLSLIAQTEQARLQLLVDLLTFLQIDPDQLNAMRMHDIVRQPQFAVYGQREISDLVYALVTFGALYRPPNHSAKVSKYVTTKLGRELAKLCRARLDEIASRTVLE